MRSLKIFGEPEVSKINVTILIQQDVFRLQVSMYDLVSMKIAKCSSYLGCYELHDIFRESLVYIEMVIQVTTSNVLQEEIDSVLILEYKVHA